jgi:hypothetical protein
MEVIKDNLLELLVDLLLLPQDNITFPLYGGVLQLRVLQNVRDDVDSDGDILAETFGVVYSLFTGSVGIEVCANVFDLELEPVLCTAASSLEGHMLQEVSGAVCSVGLCA